MLCVVSRWKYSGAKLGTCSTVCCAVSLHRFRDDTNIPVCVDAQDGLTPLTLSALYDCSEDVIHFLLELGANPNVPDVDGFRPLHFANTPLKVKLLVEAGADVDATDYVSLMALLRPPQIAVTDKVYHII